MKKLTAIALCMVLMLACTAVFAESQEQQTGVYTIYNVTGENVAWIELLDNVTGDSTKVDFPDGLANGASVQMTKSIPASEDGNHRLTLSFETESGYAGTFATLSIEEAPISLLAQDALSGATQISFTKPEATEKETIGKVSLNGAFTLQGKLPEGFKVVLVRLAPFIQWTFRPNESRDGELVFTAFSGSHQDAINKGYQYMKDSGTEYWEIPYLPIDPADVGREYEPIIRINSQSGKGGAAFVMSNNFGFDLPKRMHPEFSKLVQAKCEELERELIPKELYEVFEQNYLNHPMKYRLKSRKIYEESENGRDYVHFKGIMKIGDNDEVKLKGTGNGPIDAFFNALKKVGLDKYEFINYSQHAISHGSDSRAVSYIELKKPDGNNIFGIGIDSNVNVASVLGVLNAINRAEA